MLASHPRGRDVHIHQFSVTFHGQEILSDAHFEMNCGRRYGLLGLNGSGKSTILACIGNREVRINASCSKKTQNQSVVELKDQHLIRSDENRPFDRINILVLIEFR